ncbi:MAG TPA: hypothetical protein DIC64_05045 [Alphaproteobacteria bacterium]|nr:hypothetical protein [Alphaproteobacteria bacterium]
MKILVKVAASILFVMAFAAVGLLALYGAKMPDNPKICKYLAYFAAVVSGLAAIATPFLWFFLEWE